MSELHRVVGHPSPRVWLCACGARIHSHDEWRDHAELVLKNESIPVRTPPGLPPGRLDVKARYSPPGPGDDDYPHPYIVWVQADGCEPGECLSRLFMEEQRALDWVEHLCQLARSGQLPLRFTAYSVHAPDCIRGASDECCVPGRQA